MEFTVRKVQGHILLVFEGAEVDKSGSDWGLINAGNLLFQQATAEHERLLLRKGSAVHIVHLHVL